MRISISILYLLALSISFYSCEGATTKTAEMKDKAIEKAQEAAQAAGDAAANNDALKKMAAPAFQYGIDISSFQGDEIDLLDKAKDSLSFVICKATEGQTYTDPDFENNWKTIAEKGFIRGAYHFYHSKDRPTYQAEHFLSAIKDLKATDLPPIIDFEGGGIERSGSINNVRKNLLSFLKIVEEKSNRKPIIYTDLSTGNRYLNDPVFAAYALWIANYSDKTAPKLPAVWAGKKWSFWQKSDAYKIGNIRNDFDVFNGSRADLKQFITTN